MYPTAWRTVDAILSVECRQVSDDTFELRWPGYIQRINAEAFNIYRRDPDLFDEWCEKYSNNPIPVKPVKEH